jgi:uncharacterized phage-associated protein
VVVEDVISVASYALDLMESVPTMKLQKIVYYSQALHLVKYNEPIFDDDFEAWINGPVVPELFEAHKGRFVIEKGFFDSKTITQLSKQSRSCIDHVCNCLKDKTGAVLSELAHSEEPWINARKGYLPSEHSYEIISKKTIKDYYSKPDCTNPVFISCR